MINYTQYTFTFEESIEHEFHYAGLAGAPGEKRQPRAMATPEQIAKQNQRNRENTVRRLTKANFKAYDLWVTLKYPSGTRKSVPELKKDFRNFIRKLAYRYKKRGAELKYIYRMEVGKEGGLHVHILINRLVGAQTDVLINESWNKGHAWHTNLYEQGGYEKLAAYIVKKPDEEITGQLSLFPEKDRDDLIKYGCSRNLIRPVPVKKEYSHWRMKRILDKIEGGDYMSLATKGFYIDKASIRSGINPYTGLSYLHYTEYRIDSRSGP